MRSAVELAYNVIVAQMAETVSGGKILGKIWVEKSFDLSDIYPGCHGTADVVIYNPLEKMLTVIDFKFGAGILVEIKDNVQLLYYGLGAYTTLKNEIGEVKVIRLQIIQPRMEHEDGYARHVDVDPLDLTDFALELQKFAARAMAANAILVAGDHCRFCNAQPTCPEISEEAHRLASEAFDVIEGEEVGNLPAVKKVDLGRVLKKLPMITAWVKSIKEYAYREATSGNEIPGHKLVEKRATRKWNNDAEVASIMTKGGAVDEEIYESRKVKSVAQMEKTFTKDERTVMAQYWTAKSTGLKLVPNSEKGLAVSAGPEAEFGVIENE